MAERALAPVDGLPVPRRYWALAGLWLAMAMTVIDSSVANIALPTIGREMGVAAAKTTWVVTAYQIAIVMTLLPLASLGERLGYRRVYLGGLVLFVAMSFACAQATTFEMLAAFRFFQGLGAAAVMSVNGALIRFTWPQNLLGRGLGYNAVVVAGTAAGGPALAGFVLSIADWPWLFLVNLPIGLASLLLVYRCAPRAGGYAHRFDTASAVLSAAMFGALFLAVSEGVHGRWSPLLAGGLVVGALAGAWLFSRMRRMTRPLIPLDLIRHPRLRPAYGGSICAFAAQMCLLVSMPFLLEDARAISVGMVGLLVLPLPLALAAVSPIAGRLADKDWAGSMSAGGLSLLAVMLVLLALTLPYDLPLPAIAAAMALSGVGFGLFQAPNNHVMLRTGPIDRAGAAAGMLAFCRLTGQTGGALIAAFTLRLFGEGSVTALAAATVLALSGAALASRR